MLALIEIQLSDFGKEYKKVESRSAIILWQHIEAMAHFLDTGDLMAWMSRCSSSLDMLTDFTDKLSRISDG